jgi:cysteine desulfurase
LAIKGVAYANRGKGSHLITSVIEHPSVLNVFNYLQKKGFQVDYVPVNKQGQIEVAELTKRIRPETILISIMSANNETGMLQPIAELVAAAKKKNPEIIFHTDAIQSFGKIGVSVKKLDVDLLTISGHKIHAPKGVGVLYLRRGVRIEPLFQGGPQEYGFRAGTEPVPLIAAFGLAAEEATIYLPQYARLQDWKKNLWVALKKSLPKIELQGTLENSLPNTINIIIPGKNSEELVLDLDQCGIAVGNGSACSAGTKEGSYVLKAMGVQSALTFSSLRISFSKMTTETDIYRLIKELVRVTVKP